MVACGKGALAHGGYFETLWRLAIDAVPLPGNSHMPSARREPCVAARAAVWPWPYAEAGPAAPPAHAPRHGSTTSGTVRWPKH
ncbi:hypothetical protein CHLRE_09g410087v5 [Chlamydomonas reinhardtii]|uniref:Uncharacterized protein n=1 Tax=Chlamydomonas reinhardtii TaxID=3055 RepID=A0A2K3DFI6_CHLRE|nr:uncharacterized protein CHLRE_09g410087v5 [Chlamydomonas reinhardtii]PNW79303.1 hypothetical protein CHLRE_09g410087v5 [Chlamydomonas reinhardtii]